MTDGPVDPSTICLLASTGSRLRAQGAALALRLLAFVALSTGVAEPAYAKVLVSNTGQTRGGNYNAIWNDFAQEFTTGGNTAGYRLTSIEVLFESGLSARNVKPSIKISLSHNGVPGATLGELTKSGDLAAGLNRFEAPAGGIELDADTSYVVWLDNSANAQFAIQNIWKDNYLLYTSSDAEDSGASAGWSIGDSLNTRPRVTHTTDGWQLDSEAAWTSFEGTLRIRVNGAYIVSYDSDGDGLIEISSLAQLNALRWDLDGDGAADDLTNANAYAAAFPGAVPGMGCPITADDADDNDCTGYELAADLDFDTDGDGDVDGDDAGDSYWDAGAGWMPIGSDDSGFVATLEIQRTTANLGLFGYVGAGGQVRNVGVRAAEVRGGSNVGGLVGWNTGIVRSSSATGGGVGWGRMGGWFCRGIGWT